MVYLAEKLNSVFSDICFQCYFSCFLSLFSFPMPGIDEQLARHYAHLFIRDPLTLFHEHIYEDDEQNTDHFEVTPIQHTSRPPTF